MSGYCIAGFYYRLNNVKYFYLIKTKLLDRINCMKKQILFLFILTLGFFYFSIAQQNPMFGKTTGKLPVLSYGLGEDRLGGAKMGILDTAVVLKIVDSSQNMYKVQLSKNHSAFIEKSFLQIDSSIRQKNFYLTNSWSVRGTSSNSDLVAISMDEKLPYKSWMEINPSKIMIQLYGVQSNTNWITQLSSAKEVKNIYFNQVEDDVVQVTIELKHQQHWGYSVSYKNKSLTISVKRPPQKLKIKDLVIAVDAGHGGSNTGASGLTSKIQEKEYTLKFARELEKLLQRKGAQVIMTRVTDSNIVNSDRVIFLQNQNPDLLISLHLNSSSNEKAKGTSTYYKHIGFRPLSQAILNRMLDADLNEFGNIGHFNFMLNSPTDFLNTLVEIAFLSNADDEIKIQSVKFQKQVASEIYKGLRDFLKRVK